MVVGVYEKMLVYVLDTMIVIRGVEEKEKEEEGGGDRETKREEEYVVLDRVTFKIEVKSM